MARISLLLRFPTAERYPEDKTITYSRSNGSNFDTSGKPLSLSDLKCFDTSISQGIKVESIINLYIESGYNVNDTLIDSSNGNFLEKLYKDEDNTQEITSFDELANYVNSYTDTTEGLYIYLDKLKLQKYLNSIILSDEKLISMVLVDDENNRTIFNGSIINDFTITEDLQEKITQLTTLATNIGNLQTRLQNITNILNTQNIEFTDNVSDVSSAGSKLYIQPQYYIKLVNNTTGDIRYINMTPYVTGKYNFTMSSQYSLTATVSLKLDTEFNFNEWKLYNNIGSSEGLTVQSDGTVGNITNIMLNGILSDNTLGTNRAVLNITRDSGDTPADTCTINITFTK